MTRTEGWHEGDRYDFDFDQCTYAEGWAQVDTRQDASYYGNWINPTTLEWQSFAEGDTTRFKFDSVAEMVEFTQAFCERMDAKIDPGLDDDVAAQFRSLGLGPQLH